MSACSDITRISEIIGLPVAPNSWAVNGEGGAIIATGGGRLCFKSYKTVESFEFRVNDVNSLLKALAKLGFSAHDLAEVCRRFLDSQSDHIQPDPAQIKDCDKDYQEKAEADLRDDWKPMKPTKENLDEQKNPDEPPPPFVDPF